MAVNGDTNVSTLWSDNPIGTLYLIFNSGITERFNDSRLAGYFDVHWSKHICLLPNFFMVLIAKSISLQLFFTISLIHYFGLEAWLILKILFVLGLSIFHYYCGKWMKLFAKDLNVNSAKFFRIYNEVPTVLMIFIVIFVVFKPFL